MNIVTATVQGESKAAILSTDLEFVYLKDITGQEQERVKIGQLAATLDTALYGMARRMQQYCEGFTGSNGDIESYYRLVQQVAGV
jgi:hypothetical protein